MRKDGLFLIGFIIILSMPVILGSEIFGSNEVYNIAIGNSPPEAVDDTPKINNLDDGDNLYGGRYKEYILTVNTSDPNSNTDIEEVLIDFGYFSFKWTQVGGLIEFGGISKVNLVSYEHTPLGSSFALDFTINFEVEWSMDDIDDVDLFIEVTDSFSDTDSQLVDLNYDFITKLMIDTPNYITRDSIGDNSDLNIQDMVFYYQDSDGDNYPLGTETDFYLYRNESTGPVNEWESGSYSDATGVCSFDGVETGSSGGIIEHYYIVAYREGTTSEHLMAESFHDSIEIYSSSSGGDDGGDESEEEFGDGEDFDWGFVGDLPEDPFIWGFLIFILLLGPICCCCSRSGRSSVGGISLDYSDYFDINTMMVIFSILILGIFWYLDKLNICSPFLWLLLLLLLAYIIYKKRKKIKKYIRV